MQIQRSMLVGLCALVVAIGMLLVNGYCWWQAQPPAPAAHQTNARQPPSDNPHWPMIDQAALIKHLDHSEREGRYRRSEPLKEPARQFFPKPVPRFDPDTLVLSEAEEAPQDPRPADEHNPPPEVPNTLPGLEEAAPLAELPLLPTPGLGELIRQELPHATEEERRIWQEELQGLSPEMARDILQLRKNVAPPGLPRLGSRPESSLPWSAVPEPKKSFQEKLVPLPPLEDLTFNDRVIAGRLQPSLAALEQARDVILNNLANAQTPGFKRSRVLFEPLPYQTVTGGISEKDTGEAAPGGVSVGWGVQLAGTPLDVAQGPLQEQETDNPFDVAIEGVGFFQVENGRDVRYARCGTWSLNERGELGLVSGQKFWKIAPGFRLPAEVFVVEITENGEVRAQGVGQETEQILGTIALVRFVNPAALQPQGGHLFAASKAAGPATVGPPNQRGLGRLRQGWLEASNVSREEELAEFRAIQSHLQLLRELAGGAGGPADSDPVARQSPRRANVVSVTKTMPSQPWNAIKHHGQELRHRSNDLIEEYLNSPRVQALRRSLGLTR